MKHLLALVHEALLSLELLLDDCHKARFLRDLGLASRHLAAELGDLCFPPNVVGRALLQPRARSLLLSDTLPKPVGLLPCSVQRFADHA